MTESGMWRSLYRYVRGGTCAGDVFWRVESPGTPGLPDVLYCVGGKSGLIELKYRKEWPKRTTTKLKLGLSDYQRRRIADWRDAGGRVWVLLGVEDKWHLFDADLARECEDRGGFTREELEERSVHGRIRGAAWQPMVDFLELHRDGNEDWGIYSNDGGDE